MQIAIINPQAQQYAAALQPQFPQCDWHLASHVSELSDTALQSQVLLATPSDAAQVLNRMPNLAWLHSTFAGIDALLAEDLPKHYLLTNSRGTFGPLMSEYVFSYLLAHTQQHLAYRNQHQQALWQSLPSNSLQGQTFCCIGSGNISQHLAGTARHFGMRPVALSHSGSPKAAFDHVHTFSQQQQLCATAKVVVALLPNTQATQGLLDLDFFAALADDVVFFNVGRGATLNQQALLQFLQAKPKARAILDVTNPEPLPEDHPLWQQANCMITPHISAPSRVADIIQLFADNLSRYLQGEDLIDKVDFAKGY
ncbi:D-2-hydroxyacid dehydrogenase [Agarivorans sp. DSG3-1]|uniref:D-2-hydroxyacid dehydrogenase n=1 Tax=Agarivorans sp. DSG3-1 TaxID=3342249 RepID=UPI00398E537B